MGREVRGCRDKWRWKGKAKWTSEEKEEEEGEVKGLEKWNRSLKSGGGGKRRVEEKEWEEVKKEHER